MNSLWVTISALLLMISALVIGVGYYYSSEVNECTSNPLSYGAKQMEDQYGYEFVGRGYFITPISIKPPVVSFNITSVSIQSGA